MKVPAILLTGRPGCGKTTLIRRVIASLGVEAGGFYTREVRGPDGRRRGFEIVTLAGATATLSSVDVSGPHRVGRYGVDLANVDRVAVPALRQARERGQLVVVDEIGKMELLSAAFRGEVLRALDEGRLVLGTILLGSHPFADAVRARPDVRVIEVTETNRAKVETVVAALVREALAASGR